MGRFFIDTTSGQVATETGLRERGVARAGEQPPRPWHPVAGASGEQSTLWYAVMRKRTRGVFIGSLCFRHSAHHAFLLERGWEEVEPQEIGAVSPGPFSD